MTRPPLVVALVSSVGGLRATAIVLSSLPSRFPASIIVLQHQEPDRASVLPELLGQRTPLRVRAARDEATLESGVVEVAPPGQHTLVTPSWTLALVPSGPFPPSRPSADLLLTTLAMACGAAAIAVVLSGGGHDAATGATVVHHRGGLVLATDEASSQAFEMPSATIHRDRILDEVLPLNRIGPRLVELAAGATEAPGS